ncbi:MAG: hypothetical protein IT373_02480 [Polyangiaceae bacterium]|nr:hypothetical protein [Polyangiaceae bacterium]
MRHLHFAAAIGAASVGLSVGCARPPCTVGTDGCPPAPGPTTALAHAPAVPGSVTIAGAPSTLASVASAVPPATTASTPVPAPPHAPVRELPVRAPSTEAACSVESADWDVELAFEPDGAPFGEALGAQLRLELSQSGHTVFAHVDGPGARLAAWAPRANVYLARPRAVGRLVYPRAGTALVWEGAGRKDAVRVSVDVSGVLAEPTVVREELPCVALTPRPGEFDVRAGFPPALPIENKILADRTPLSDRPGGPTLARAGEGAFEIVAQRAGATQILFVTMDWLVAGWAPSNALSEGETGFGLSGRGEGGRMAVPWVATPSERPTCNGEVPLFVEVAGRRARIGTTLAGNIILLGDGALDPPRADGFVPVVLPVRRWLALAPGAQLLARLAELEACWR